MKIVISGAGGLIGRHAAVRVHAANCAARFKGVEAPFELVALNHRDFDDDSRLQDALLSADGVLHFAGVNRARDEVVETENPAIARRLAEACAIVGARPHVIYANSIHAMHDTPYGRSKRIAGEILSEIGGRYTDIVLPHVFGEGARPRYNNVTATFIEAVINGQRPKIDLEGKVSLLHAGAVAQAALDALRTRQSGVLRPEARETRIPELFDMLEALHAGYSANIFPDLRDSFTVELFNSYRASLCQHEFSRPLKLNTDARGTLFEAVKGGGGGQTFLSTTKPGVTRGDHFHLNKVERFLVVQGEAVIRTRKALSDELKEYHVSGDDPMAFDMPTLHTHSIENVGSGPLLTLFWTHDLFDPAAPDTFFDPVLKA